MPVLTIAAKDLRLLMRDARAAVILLFMPLALILVLGLALGEGFGQKPDERLRISVVNLDRGLPQPQPFPPKPWSEMVIDDLTAAGDIRIEMIPDLDEAERLVAQGKRSAVIVFEPGFSDRMNRASFLTHAVPPPINPLGRDGVRLEDTGVALLKDPTQPVASSVIEQVAQVTMLRVVVPWMIGRAFERVGDEQFMEMLAAKLNKVKPIPAKVLTELDPVVQKLLAALFADPAFEAMLKKEFGSFGAAAIKGQMPQFRKLISRAFQDEELMARVGKEIAFGEVMTPEVRKEIGPRVQAEVQDLFSNYNFRAKTWAGLTKTREREGNSASRSAYTEADGSGILKRGAMRYQILVPSYTVMFAFFLVLTVGWLFVAERKHGTLVRLRAAPLTRGQILLGKLIPCLVVSLVQGFFLLLAGKGIFGMNWGTQPWLLVPVVFSTSAAAVGLAMLVASVARSETQVAVYGTLLVLVLGGISGSLMPRDLMPEQMKQASLITPHAWALDAYSQVLGNPNPDLSVVFTACAVLLGFGAVFLALAWWRLDLE